MFFFHFETKSSNQKAIWSMGGFCPFGEGDSKDNGKGDRKKIYPKCMLLGTFGVIWGDLATFLSDFNDFRMQNHSVLLNDESDS